MPATRLVVKGEKTVRCAAGTDGADVFLADFRFFQERLKKIVGDVRMPETAMVLPIKSCGLLMSLCVTKTHGEVSEKLMTMTSGRPATAAEMPLETDVK